MANTTALTTELNEDPLGRGYANMTDAEAADDLNTAYVTQYIDIPVGRLAGVIELEGIYEQLEPSGLAEAQKLLRIVRGETAISELAYSLSQQRTKIDEMLDALVSQGVLSGGQAEKLKALGFRKITRAQQKGLLGGSDRIGFAHVQQARSN